MFDPVSWLRRHAFAATGAGASARVGAEVELLSLDADTRAPVDVNGRLLPFLGRWAAGRGGELRTGPKGGLRVAMPGGAAFAIEPGGQLEFASAPTRDPSALLGTIDDVLRPLTLAAADENIELAACGIDPVNPPAAAPLQVAAERYCCMDAYFETIGPAGRRMMRQTAAVQLNVDPAGTPDTVWRVFNAAAPLLTALFANSRFYAGCDTGFASFRAETWRRADPLRTGIIQSGDDSAAAYAQFALAAPSIRPCTGGEYRPFGEHLRDGTAQIADWEDHLSTLFPEVRPKHYLEIRSMDARPVEELALPVLVCAGIALDPHAAADAHDLLGPADPALLETAGRSGLRDPFIAARCRDLVQIALKGCQRIGAERCRHDDIARAAELAGLLLSVYA